MNEQLSEYLSMIAKCRGKKPEALKYFPEEFLLKYGREYPIWEGTFDGPRMEQKQCFMNASRIAMIDKDVTYCEGFALGIIPFEHAWLIDKQGRVIDPTLKPNYASVYFGVTFKREYLLEQLLKQKVYGLLNGMNNPDLYTGKTKEQEWRKLT